MNEAEPKVELRNLARLCDAFSGLSEENKKFTLDVSQALLTLQEPRVLPFPRQGLNPQTGGPAAKFR
ncbi:hypothetical protein AGMMS50267_08370 [Spirochaetia bacterium]|nr:hypothetical protein AGMMS50267_08370 [Spirochaetia bacterium]